MAMAIRPPNRQPSGWFRDGSGAFATFSCLSSPGHTPPPPLTKSFENPEGSREGGVLFNLIRKYLINGKNQSLPGPSPLKSSPSWSAESSSIDPQVHFFPRCPHLGVEDRGLALRQATMDFPIWPLNSLT